MSKIKIINIGTQSAETVHVSIIIDVFRASTTACYVLEGHPKVYILATKSAVISKLGLEYDNKLLIGKAEKDSEIVYNIPNSPTRVLEVEIIDKSILHRTEAGAKGVLLAKEADAVLLAGFVNAKATVNFLKSYKNIHIEILPMGHEGTNPSLEDDICAMYIENLIKGKEIFDNLEQYLPELREGAGNYFFSKDQWQYPKEDFQRCLELNKFHFSIKAEVFEDYSILTRWDEFS